MRSRHEILMYQYKPKSTQYKDAIGAMKEFGNEVLDELLTRVLASLSEGKAKNEADVNALLLSTVRDIKNDMK